MNLSPYLKTYAGNDRAHCHGAYERKRIANELINTFKCYKQKMSGVNKIFVVNCFAMQNARA